MKERKNIHVVTLGCSKNLVDSEHLMRQIESSGYKVTHNSDQIKSGTVIVNTCGFIRDAKQESIDTILEFAQAKAEGKIRNLFVMGCLSELYKDDLRKEIAEVDEFFGVNSFDEILKKLGIGYDQNLLSERFQTTPKHYAYLKISEGCNRDCAFCAIPAMRGLHVSLPMESLEEEARLLAARGVKELIIVAQDISYYGIDIYKEPKLPELIEKLAKVPGIEWIRLHYAYPNRFPMDLIRVMKQYPNICKYLDIPLQHSSDKVLQQMRRGNTREQATTLINNLRSELPGIAIRTTLLVGFPGETEDDFNDLLDFVEQTKFDRLGVFPYSHEEHTYAFAKYADDVPEETKQDRVDRLMALQQQISETINLAKVGNTYKVLIDRKEGDFFIGRTQFDSPEVDNEVLVPLSDKLSVGKFYDVKITESNDYDLFGEVIR